MDWWSGEGRVKSSSSHEEDRPGSLPERVRPGASKGEVIVLPYGSLRTATRRQVDDLAAAIHVRRRRREYGTSHPLQRRKLPTECGRDMLGGNAFLVLEELQRVS